MSGRNVFRPRNLKAITAVAVVATFSGLVALVGFFHLSASNASNSLPARGVIGGAAICLGALCLLFVLGRGTFRECLTVENDALTYTQKGRPTLTCRRADVTRVEVVSDMEMSPRRSDGWHLYFLDATNRRIVEVRFANRYGQHAVRELVRCLGNVPLIVQPPLWT